jgi:transposase
MPLDLSILKLAEYEIIKATGINPVRYTARYTGKVSCPFCSSEDLKKKDKYIRKLNHETIGLRRTILYLEARKFHCNYCKKYFNQRFPGIQKYRRSTEAFREEVFERHRNGHTLSYLSRSLYIGTATVERWSHDYLKRKISESAGDPCPRVMGIDEHFFTRKAGYATTICDLAHHKVYDVVLGRTEAALNHYFRALKGKEDVQVVVMDLSRTYRNIISKHFPNAAIVSDRFHVIRLVNFHFLKVWADIDPTGRKNRGLLSLMRRHRWNLSMAQRGNLYNYLDSFPGLRAIYDFKQDLCRLLLKKKCTAKRCKKLIPVFLDYIYQLKQSALSSLVTLGKTLESWQEEVVRMFRFTKSNGILEGFHNKMENISRRAYGFKNFENYRLRVKALCC